MTTCTWEGCQAAAKHDLVSQDCGDVYAKLCDDHKKQFDRTVAQSGPNKTAELLHAWILAQGGERLAHQRRVKRALHRFGVAS